MPCIIAGGERAGVFGVWRALVFCTFADGGFTLVESDSGLAAGEATAVRDDANTGDAAALALESRLPFFLLGTCAVAAAGVALGAAAAAAAAVVAAALPFVAFSFGCPKRSRN